jgi:hypothetical protein
LDFSVCGDEDQFFKPLEVKPAKFSYLKNSLIMLDLPGDRDSITKEPQYNGALNIYLYPTDYLNAQFNDSTTNRVFT